MTELQGGGPLQRSEGVPQSGGHTSPPIFPNMLSIDEIH